MTPVESSLPLLIGDGYTSNYVGGIDEVAVYGRALTAAEVLEHYVAMVTGDDAAYETAVSDDVPVSYWRLDEAAGPFAADEQAANPGTYQGTPVTCNPEPRWLFCRRWWVRRLVFRVMIRWMWVMCRGWLVI